MIDPCGSITGVKELGEHHSTLHFLRLSSIFLSKAEPLASMDYSDALIKAYWQEHRDVGNRFQYLKKLFIKFFIDWILFPAKESKRRCL